MVDRERFREGNHQYFSEVIRDYGRVVKAVCLSYAESEDDVSDLIQECWTLAYEKRHSFRAEGSFAAWLHRLTRNHCTDAYRSRTSRRQGLEKFAAMGAIQDLHRRTPSPAEELERKESERTLWNALDALPEKERDAIILRLIQRRTPGEVAEEMKIEKASVRSNISRGIKRLRGLIGGADK